MSKIKVNELEPISGSIVYVTGTVSASSDLYCAGNTEIAGNLTVNGTTTTIDTTNMVVEDPLLVLAKNVSGTPSFDAGLIVERGSSTNAAIIWDESRDEFSVINTTEAGSTAGNVSISSYANFQAGDLYLTGNIGVGTTSPSSQIEVEGSSGDLAIEIDNNVANSANFKISVPAGSNRVDLIANALTGNPAALANTTIAMKDQRVGINDTTPSYTLDVNGDGRFTGNLIVSGTLDAHVADFKVTADTMTFGDASGDTVTFNASTVSIPNNLNFDSNTLFLDASNNRVGIGTASPSNVLEIEGSSGDLVFEIDNNASNSANFQIQNGAGNARVDLVMNDGSTNTTITMKDQKVGIGDTSPSYALDVNGTLRAVGLATFDAGLSAGDANITNVGDIALDSISSDAGTSINVTLGTDAGDDFIVATNAFVVEGDTKRIGIGTATPSSNLEIEGSSGDLILEIDNNASNSANFQIQNGAGNARVDLVMNDGSASTTITMKGQKVGIGDTSPSYSLDVTGNGRFTTDLLVGDDLSLTSDSSVLNFGAGDDVTFTHDGGTGLDIASAGDFDITSTAGNVTITSQVDEAASIYLRENAGTSGAIKIHADQGTSVTEGAASVSLLSDAGGVELRSTANLANAINITNDGGTTGTITIFNDQGTSVTEGAASIQLLTDAGGIGIKSTANLASAILLTADGGTSETIKVHADQGTGAASIELLSDAGGVTISAGNTTHGVKLGTVSGAPVTIGHTTSETTVADNLTVTGDLTVNGTTTTVNSTTMTVDDPLITLGGDTAPGSDDNKDRGIEFRWHNGSAAKIGFFGYDDSQSLFTFIPDATNSSEVFSGTVGDALLTKLYLYDKGDEHITSDGTDMTLAAGRNIVADAAGDITLSADGGNVTMNDGTITVFDFDTDSCVFTIFDDADTDGDRDYFKIAVGAAGATTISTNDDGGAAANLTMTVDGTVEIDAAGNLAIESSGGSLSIGADDIDQDINIGTQGERAIRIGTGAFADTIAIGNATGATAVSITSGTGHLALASTGAGDITIDSDDTLLLDADGVLELNSSAGAISIGNDNVDQTINLATAGTRTLNIGILDGTDTTTITSKGNQTHSGTITVGVDDTGYDVKFFGATSGQYMLWDESEDELVLAGDTKLSFHDAAGGENIIASADGHLEINAGTTLDATAPTIDLNAATAITLDTVLATFESSTSLKPLVIIKNTTNDANSATLRFVKDKGAAGADNDKCGIIEFYGDDDNQDNIAFARITALVADASNGDECGKLTLGVAENDGNITSGLTLTGSTTDGEVDVNIGAGTSSITTVAGVLSLGDRNITNVGDISLDSISSDGSLVTVNAPCEIANGSSTGAPALIIDNDDADQMALWVDGDANTTANVAVITADALTSASALIIDSDSSSTTSRQLVKINNDNTAATGAIPLYINNDAVAGPSSCAGLAIRSTAAETGPLLRLENSNTATDKPPSMMFFRSDFSAEADNMQIGSINFAGADDGTPGTGYKSYAAIHAKATEVGDSSAAEEGTLDFTAYSGGSSVSHMVVGAGSVNITCATPTSTGGGIDAAAPTMRVAKVNGEIVTTILINIGGGSIVSSSTAGDVIGENDTANAYVTRLTRTINGLVYRGEMVCLEVPTTGDPDINLCANSSGTIAEDAAGEGQHVLVNGGTWTLALKADLTIPSGGINDDYLYLTHGGTTAGTYDAGKYMIKLYGVDPTDF